MRELIILVCGECKRQNYHTKRNKKTHTEKLELKKFCRWCDRHTAHKEKK